MRSSSGGKFSLGSAFGRRDKHDRTGSYSGNDFGVPNTAETTQTNSRINGAAFNEPDSPNARSGGEGGGSGGGVQLKKLGKTFAHNNLLPGLGNKDLKALQDVIAAEKGVLSNTEKLAIETQKAASVLPNYGLQEGPDLQDVLTQSSHLLNHFSAALNVYAERQVSLRGSYKKIRDREETFSELRSQRRSTGSKAETAERKLAKMGPENKGLVSQTELLERLRQEMRTMDSEIVKEETALGDFKRQIVKEAFMYKFSGLEELGEKLCIIGEMGKLVIDEIPLEETPVGYGRAPYGGFTKTETAVEEAGRCLGQVKFAAVETTLKPSHLPHAQHLPGRTSVLHRQESISAAEEFAHFPAGMTSPQTPGRQDSFAPPPNGGTYGLDENPYGGIDNRATNSHNAYGEYGGVRGDSEGDSRRQTLWQGPTEDALRQQNRASDGIEYAQSRIASMYGPPLANGNGGGAAGERGPVVSFGALPTPSNPHPVAEEAEGQDYEHQQQAELDRQHEHEQAAWREQSDQTRIAGQHDAPLPNPYDTERTGTDHAAAHSAMSPPWQPLNVKRDKSITPEPRALHDPPVAPYISEPTTDSATGPGYTQSDYHSEAHSAAPSELIPPPSMAQLHARAPTPGTEGFRTPAESPSLDTAASYTHSAPTIPAFSQFALQPPIATPTAPTPPSPPLPIPVPGFAGGARPASPSAMSPSAGKMSAGAFRKAAPRRSETAATVNGDEEGSGSDVGRGSRRLPVPPGGYTPGVAGPSGMVSPGLNAPGAWPDEKRTLMGQKQDDVVGVEHERGAPPSYAHGASAGQHDESLR